MLLNMNFKLKNEQTLEDLDHFDLKRPIKQQPLSFREYFPKEYELVQSESSIWRNGLLKFG